MRIKYSKCFYHHLLCVKVLLLPVSSWRMENMDGMLHEVKYISRAK